MPSASTQPGPISSTWSKPRTSSRRRAPASRSRNRFDVSLARPTGPAPALSCAASASFFRVCWLRGFAAGFVEVAPRHREAGHRDVALREHDLEEMRAPARRAEHLGAAVEVHAPDAAEALGEARRVERADLVPARVEALAPRVERQRIV